MLTLTSLVEADERRQQLTLEIQGIQAQLGDRQRTGEDGRRLNAHEYWVWNKRAHHALNQKLDELRSVKAWIRQHRLLSYDPGRPAVDLAVHLESLCTLLEDLNLDVELDPEELAKVQSARQALATRPT